MKKYIMLICIIFFCGNIDAKLKYLPDGINIDYTVWDWEDQASDNWSKDGTSIPAPFAVRSARVGLMHEIYDSGNMLAGIPGDWTYEGGWRLVSAHLTSVRPYFILYNVNNGLLRAFMYTNTSGNFRYVGFSIVPKYQSKESKNLAFLEKQLVAADDKDYIFSKERVTVFTEGAPDQWVAFEIPILFDNNITNLMASWEIYFYFCNEFKLSVELNGQLTPLTASANNIVSHNEDPGSSSSAGYFDAEATQSTINLQINNVAQWQTKINNITKKINDNKDIKAYVKKWSDNLSKLAEINQLIASLASSGSADFKLASSILDIILGGGEAKSNAVLGYNIGLKGHGSIQVLTAVQGNTISAIPGSKYSSSKLEDWQYQCPMGVFNLKETPTLYYKTRSGNAIGTANGTAKSRWKTPYDYIIKDEVEFNVKEGINLIDMKFALLVKEDENHTFVDNRYYDKYRDGRKFDSEVFKYLNDGRLILYDYEEIGPNGKGRFEYGTPFVDKNQLKFLQIPTLEQKTKISSDVTHTFPQEISLGVIISYTSDSDPERKIHTFKGKFKCNTKPYDNTGWWNNSLIYPYTLPPYSDITLLGQTYFSPIHAVNKIIMPAGFVGIPGFLAKASYVRNDYGGFIPSAPFSYDCHFNVGPNNPNPPYISTRATTSLEEEAPIEKVEAQLYPNPTTGTIYITEVEDQTISKVEVLNMGGKLVDVIKGVTSSFDISAHPDGMYIIRVHSNDGVATHRIILRK